MLFELKPLHAEAIDRSLDRAERYRLLNEPWEAESICHDVLATQPENQRALVMLLLALTDQFERPGVTHASAYAIVSRLATEYDRVYYAGVISERWAKQTMGSDAPGSVVYEWFAEALRLYDKAAALAPKGNEDAVLRWNACVRVLQKHPRLQPQDPDVFDEGFGDHVPGR